MSVMDGEPAAAIGPEPTSLDVQAQLARVRFHLARARELRLRAERLAAEERRLREERRPRGFFIGFI